MDWRKRWILGKTRGLVLNVGCGHLKVDGVNLDVNMAVNPDVTADFHNLPFREKIFDHVVCFDVLEHSDEPRRLVNEVERVGKNIVFEVLDFDKARENWMQDPSHMFYVNKKILKKFLRSYMVFSVGKMLFALKGITIRFPTLNFLFWKLREKLRRKYV